MEFSKQGVCGVAAAGTERRRRVVIDPFLLPLQCRHLHGMKEGILHLHVTILLVYAHIRSPSQAYFYHHYRQTEYTCQRIPQNIAYFFRPR